MKKLSNLINEKVTDVQWLEDSIEHVDNFLFPLTKSIAKELGIDQKIIAVHFTDPKGAMRLISIQGTNKSISTMTQIPKRNASSLQGVHKSGVAYKVEGNLIVGGETDIDTSPDQRGRRWVSLHELLVSRGMDDLLASDFSNDYESFLYQDPRYKKLKVKYELSQSKGIPSPDIQKKLISLHFDLSLEFVRKKKAIFLKVFQSPLSPLKISDGGRWNEIILNNIKLIGVIYDKDHPELGSKLEDKIVKSVPEGKSIGVNSIPWHGDQQILTKFQEFLDF